MCGNEFLATSHQIIHRKRVHCDEHKIVRTKNTDYAAVETAVREPNGYKSLSGDDKKRIVLAAANGDREAQKLMLMIYDRFAWSRAVEFARRRRPIMGELDVDELVQECRLALLEAASEWKPELGAFTTLASYHMLNAMTRRPNSGTSSIDVPAHAHKSENTLEHVKRARAIASIDAPLADDNDRTLADVIATDTDEPGITLDKCRMALVVQNALGLLSPREQLVAKAYFWHDQTMEEIGASLDLTRARIGQIVERVVIKLRKYVTLSVK